LDFLSENIAKSRPWQNTVYISVNILKQLKILISDEFQYLSPSSPHKMATVMIQNLHDQIKCLGELILNV